ncbi:MAG: hypothetical protein ACRDHP_07975 [Ktedonobacterales bacterium]
MARSRKPPKPRARKPPKPRAHHPRPPDVHATTRATVGDAFGHGRSAIPAAGPHPALGGSHAIELDAASASPGLFDVILELVGAEHATLRQTLALWQREQDRTLNRTWRRPGGLTRPAGL